MLITKLVEAAGPNAQRNCDACGKAPAALEMHGYSEGASNICLCAECALQLARKLLEDLCALLTKKGRHG
jgi:hypothetical protein